MYGQFDISEALDSCIAACTAAEAEIDASIEQLIKSAQEVSDGYYKAFEAISGQNGNDIGTRFPSVRVKEGVSGNIMEIRWMRSVKSPYTESRIRTSYRKGTASSYNIVKITKNAPEWEAVLVRDAEMAFSKLRENYNALMKVKRALAVAHNRAE